MNGAKVMSDPCCSPKMEQHSHLSSDFGTNMSKLSIELHLRDLIRVQ